jgi:hypothetical protein
MFGIIEPPKTNPANTPAPAQEGWQVQEQHSESEQLNQGRQTHLVQHLDTQNQLKPANQALVKLNLLDALDFITDKITKLEDPTSYLQARSEFLKSLNFCQNRLEKHEKKTFIPMLEKQKTDTLRLDKYVISFKPSKKTVIDSEKLTQALSSREQIAIFQKPPEFKTLPECRRLLLNLGILSDVFTIKQGKKPILNIIDTNTIRRPLAEVEMNEAEETEESDLEATQED